jgi:hypothetical protein
MPQTVILPSGNSAVLRDKAELTEGHRRPVRTRFMEFAVSKGGDDLAAAAAEGGVEAAKTISIAASDAGLIYEMGDLLIAALVKTWSFDFPPSTDAALQLPGEDYDELSKACQRRLDDFIGLVDFDPNKDPARDTPTTP